MQHSGGRHRQIFVSSRPARSAERVSGQGLHGYYTEEQKPKKEREKEGRQKVVISCKIVSDLSFPCKF